MGNKETNSIKENSRVLVDITQSITTRALASMNFIPDKKKEAERRLVICKDCDVYTDGVCDKSKRVS